MNGIILLHKPMKKTTNTNSTHDLLQLFQQKKYLTQTYSLGDSLVNLSQSLENEKDLLKQGEHSFLKSVESLGLKEYRIYCLRMLKDCSHMITVKHFQPLSDR